MDEINEIKSCPFCGGRVRTFHIPENTDEEIAKHPRWKWRNPGCWAIGCCTPMCPGNLDRTAMVFIAEENAIKEWNRRKWQEDGEAY